MPEPKTLRTRVYIDGYNLYYGCLKGTPFKWLDPLLLLERHILPSILVEHAGRRVISELSPLAIKFFTARILDKLAKAPDSVSSQANYHMGLYKAYDGRIECIQGSYSLTHAKMKIVDAENPDKWPRECQEILVWKPEEKQTDVRLALQAYHDARSGEVEHVVVVTNDTDIAPALEMIRAHTTACVGLIVPTRNEHVRRTNADLAKHTHWVRSHITDAELRASQLPRVLGTKRHTAKPMSWYPQPARFELVLEQLIGIRKTRAEAFKWLEVPCTGLGGARPIDLMEGDDGFNQVAEFVEAYITTQTAAEVSSD